MTSSRCMDHHLFCVGVVLAIYVVGFKPDFVAGKCNSPTTKRYASIPSGMSLELFEAHIVGKTLGELYYAIPVPPKYIPDGNYVATIKKSNNNSKRYYTESFAESDGPNSECKTGNVSLDLLGNSKTARFVRYPDNPTGKMLQVMWSSCPEMYIWSMRCEDFKAASTGKCLMKDVALGLYLHQTDLHDLPMADIVKDICPTGIHFGASDFKWFYSFGKNTLCQRR